MIHTGAHCILSTPSYPYPIRPYKLCTSYRHRKSVCTSPILPNDHIHDVSLLDPLLVVEALSMLERLLGKAASYTSLS